MGDNIYVFIYSTSKDNFDKSLPIAEHMIKSFKFGPEAHPLPPPTTTTAPTTFVDNQLSQLIKKQMY